MLAVPVVIGVRLTGKAGKIDPGAGSQSWLSPAALTGVHRAPESGDGPEPDVQVGSQVPEFVTPGVPPIHSGHGDAAFPVKYTVELSGKLPLTTPVVLLSVPLAGEEKVFCTQVEVPALAIGRYGPKWQPVFEQLLMLPVCAAVRALIVHAAPAQVAVICVSAFAGVGPSATVDWPPPTLSPLQLSVLRITPPAPPERTEPHAPTPVPVMNRRTRGTVVVVDELVDVLVLLLVLVVELLLVLVVELVLVLVEVVDEVLVVLELVLVVLLVLVLVVVVLLVLVEVLLLDDVEVLDEVVVLVEVVGGPLAQSVSDPATAPSAMNCPGSSFLIVEASKRAQLRSVPVVIRMTTSPAGTTSGMPVSLPTTFNTLVSLNTTTLTGTGPNGASLLMYL
jgi:hypothetical protein